MRHVLICGTSTRAAAASAARAGFRVTALDAYADRDQHASVSALSAARDFATGSTASAMARAAARLEADVVVYLSPFENHPRAVARLAHGRTLWGNSPDTLRRVRDPFELAAVLRRNGFAVPHLANDPNDSNDPNDPNDSWLVKPCRSGGGNRIRLWSGTRVLPTSYLQKRIDGTAGSLVFVAADGRCVPLGLSRQLVGDANFGGQGYRYCGSVLASLDDQQFARGRVLLETAVAQARCVAAEFGLLGINGLDFVARDGVPYPVEVNPRWSSSVEVAEHACEATFFPAHADACHSGALPAVDCRDWLFRTAAIGKAIVYARRACTVGDTDSWLHDPALRDVPRSGESFRSGQPVCSVLATAADSQACYRALVDRVQRVYADLERASR
jgi:predicted ATP-grasp superfamily ATP-dependent carboligase